MLKLAGIQLACYEEKERNIEKAVKFVQIAVEKGAKIICFQELFATPWFPREMNKEHFSFAEKTDGPSITSMQELSRDHEVVIICPIFEKGEEGFFNSAVVIDAGGKILGQYRKIHVPQIPLWEEKYYFSPGNLGFPVFKTEFAVIGIQICWDNFFPEGSRSPDGSIQPFKKGGFSLAIKSKVPIVPIAIAGSREIMPKDRLTIAAGDIRIRMDHPIETGAYSIRDRNSLMERVSRTIGENFKSISEK